MASTHAIVSTTDTTIPDMASLKNIQSRSIGMDASDVIRYSFDPHNLTATSYVLENEISVTTTLPAGNQSFGEEIRAPLSIKGRDRLKEGSREAVKSLQLNIKQEPEHEILRMERELDNLQSDEQTTVDSDTDNNVEDDDDGIANAEDEIEMNDVEVIDEIDIENDRFNGFPKQIIKDAKLVIRGKQLVELMSKFYRLECDLCEDAK